MFTLPYDVEKIGIISRADGTSQFFMQDAKDKDIIVGDEFIVNDVNADHLKLWLEGSKFATYERKNVCRKKMQKRIPFLLASNDDICIMAMRHSKAIGARLLRFNLQVATYNEQLPMIWHSLDKKDKFEILKQLVELSRCS